MCDTAVVGGVILRCFTKVLRWVDLPFEAVGYTDWYDIIRDTMVRHTGL